MTNYHLCDIKFKQKIKTIIAGSGSYFSKETLLLYKGEVFDIENDHIVSKQISKIIIDQYYAHFSALCFPRYKVMVLLSGLDIELAQLIKDYIFSNDGRRNVIFQYSHWPCVQHEGMEEHSFMLVECDISLFKELFYKYWFSIGVEYRFLGFAVELLDKHVIERWAQLEEDNEITPTVIENSVFVFDNLYNGLHFRMAAKTMKIIENSKL